MNWTPEQYNELTERYRDLSDADLRRLAAAPEDLTEIAQEVLGKEIARRKLDVEGPDSADWYNYAQMAPPGCSFEFEIDLQAEQAAALLSENRIEHMILSSSTRKLAEAGPRVVVLPKDAERAAQLLSHPIPDSVLEELEQEREIASQEFVPPACPTCHATEAMLIDVDPTNRWLCEACEHEWDDPAQPA